MNKLREKLEAIAKELESSSKDTYLSSVAKERAAELAVTPLKQPAPKPSKPAPSTEQLKSESHTAFKAKERRPKTPMQPKVDELADAEKKPKLFEPAVGPPPKVGEEELAAEGTGQEVLLQVCLHY